MTIRLRGPEGGLTAGALVLCILLSPGFCINVYVTGLLVYYVL